MKGEYSWTLWTLSHVTVVQLCQVYEAFSTPTQPQKSGNSRRKGSKESVGGTSKENVAVVPSPSKNSKDSKNTKDSKGKDELQLWMKIFTYSLCRFLNLSPIYTDKYLKEKPLP